jgi:DNA-binding beta-propeller fold protein YncE
LPVAGRIDGTMPLAGVAFGPLALAVGFGSVWVAMPAALPYSATSRGELLRLSPDLTKVQARIPVGWAPSSIAITSTAVWVADSRGDLSNPDGRQDLVERIDPATDAVTAGVMVDDPQRLTAAGHAVWVTPGARAGSTRLLRISDAAAVAGMATVEGTVADVEVDGNDLWAAANDPAAGPDRVLRIDATSGAVIATIPLANQVGPLIVAPGAVLATVAGDSSGSDGVQAIDPATNALSGAIRNGNALAGSVVRLIGPSIWVADQGAVTAVDPRSLQRVAAPLTVVDSPGASVVAIDGDAGAIWILTGTGVVRVIPARLGP